ncbi:hypothetical protein PtB15_2B293 [Puccinia triticina]|nr:hypothetical protein PtB15_2B293 [Puccinia triticina]
MLCNLENPIEAPCKLKIDELRKFATEQLQEQDLDYGSELTAISDRATSDSESGSKDEDIKSAKDTRTGGRVPTSSPPAQELTSGSPLCYCDETISTPAPKPAKPVTRHKPAKQPPGEPQREVKKSPHLWHPGMTLIFSTSQQDEVPAASCSMPHPPATTSKNVSIIDSPVGRRKSEPLTPSKLQDQSPVASPSKKSSGRISPILIDIISSKIPSDAAHLAIKPNLFQSDNMQILTTINFSKSLPENTNSSVNDTAPAIYMDVPLDAVNVPILPLNANCSMNHISLEIYLNAPLEMCNIHLPHLILPVKSVSLLPQKNNSLKVQDNQLCKSKRNSTVSKAIVPMEVDTDYHKAPIEDPIEEPGPRTIDDIFQWLDKNIEAAKLRLQLPPPPFVPLTSITSLQQQPESQLPPASPTTHFRSANFEFWDDTCSMPEKTEAFKTGKPSVWDRPSTKGEENTPALETAPAASQLPQAGSKLPSVDEEQDLSSPPLPKAEDNPSAPPQLPGAVSELQTINKEEALPSPPFPKANNGAPALPQLPGTVLELPTTVKVHAPSSPPLLKVEDDTSAFPQLPGAVSQLLTAVEQHTLSSLPLPKAKDGAPPPPQLPGAVSELPTTAKEHAPSAPPLLKVKDDAPALPQLPGTVSELPTAVKQHPPSSPPLPKAEDNTPALPQLPGAVSELLTAVEQHVPSSLPLLKAKDNAPAPTAKEHAPSSLPLLKVKDNTPALPQLLGAISEVLTAVKQHALSSPPLPKAEDDTSALLQLPATVLELPTTVKEHVPSSPPLPKAEDNAPAPPQLPEAASVLPTANKGDTPSSLPLSKAKDNPPALPQLLGAVPELPTVDKEEALSSPPFPKADNGAPALPQLPGAVLELSTAVEEHTLSSPPLPKVEDNPPALPQLPGAVSELPAILTEASLELLIAAEQDVYFSLSLPRAEDDTSGSDSTTALAANLHFEPCLSPSTIVMESADLHDLQASASHADFQGYQTLSEASYESADAGDSFGDNSFNLSPTHLSSIPCKPV